MAEAEGLSRKKKVKAAHRASAMRSIAQAQVMMEGESGEATVAKLKQKRQALNGKAELLNKVDGEIAEVVEEDNLGDEIEQADEVHERIELAIIDLDAALEAFKIRPMTGTSPAREVLRSHVADRDHVEPVTPRVDALVADSHEAMATIPPSHDRINLGRHAPSLKLPKLSLKKFNGNLIKWMTFWDTFESSVHNNPTLSGIDKFNYLNYLLESEAADAISGLTLTAANYEEAVTTLKRRFGNKQLICESTHGSPSALGSSGHSSQPEGTQTSL